MMKKKNKGLLLLLFVWMTVQSVTAADYLVYSAIGDIQMWQGNKKVSVSARTTIHSDTKLVIGKESAVNVLDERNSKMYSFTKQGTSTVASLIQESKTAKNLSGQYVSYLVKQLFSKESKSLRHPDTYMQTTATSYRATSKDSLLLNKLSFIAMGNSLNTVESALVDPKVYVIGDLDVWFELVSCTTGLPIGKQVEKNANCYVRVHNQSKVPVYVNVLNVDDKGKKYLVLPVDEAALCSHLLVPAESTVAFTSEPFQFAEGNTKEAFLLVASEEPVDFSILMSPIKGNGGKHLRSGLYRNLYFTH